MQQKNNRLFSKSGAVGIVVINLGTPTEPTVKAVRQYLREFLSDPYVVRLPRFLWLLLLNSIILPLRARRVAKNYQAIWYPEGSPLRVITLQIAKKLQETLNLPVIAAMRYGEPGIFQAIAELQQQGVQQFIVLPLFPQYSTATTASIIAKIDELHLSQVAIIPHYFDQTAYIQLLARQVRQHWAQHGQAQQLLIAFHGLPKKFIEEGDPYEQQCQTTAQLLAQALELDAHQWQICYQSRFGKAAWLQPYMLDLLQSLPSQQVTSVDIISPGFAADCLETLEELAIQNRQVFLKAGGKNYSYIPALNDQVEHITCLADIITHQLKS